MSRPQPTSIRLVLSLLPWVIVGGALIYLSPVIAHLILRDELTSTWLKTLSRSGYYVKEATIAAIISTLIGIVLTVKGNGQQRSADEKN
jgi:fructose-specific phosphotransferase system IIC component